MKENDVLNIVKYRIELSKSTIEESLSHLNNGFLNTAMNRIYYAGYYIVNALALLDNFSTSKHKQLIGYFMREYVKTNKIDRNTGKILNICYERREAADYHDFVYLTKSQIEDLRQKMVAFISEVEKIINVKLKEKEL